LFKEFESSGHLIVLSFVLNEKLKRLLTVLNGVLRVNVGPIPVEDHWVLEHNTESMGEEDAYLYHLAECH
jgi:hypothetical protein